MRRESSDVEVPIVSIVIPARNEAHHLPRVFAALEKLDYPLSRREVILVDNGSTDETAKIAGRYGAIVVSAPGVRVGEVRNRGARLATGSLLAFVDADCLVPPRWLREGVRLLADDNVGAVGGGCQVPPEGNWIELAWVGDEPIGDSEVEAIATSSFMLRRSLFDDLGGFDGNLGAGEDDDLSHRVREAGYRLYQTSGCSVVHMGYPRSLLAVTKRQIWHGRSQLQARRGLEPMLLLTHAFALCIFLLGPYALLSGKWVMMLLVAMVTLGIAGVPAAMKSLKSRAASAKLLAQRVVVYWCFFLGRAMGLAMSYRDLFNRRVKPVARVDESR